MKNINKPIIFIGMGRSGSSLIFNTFLQNQMVGFVSQYCTRFPQFPQLSALHRITNNFRTNNRKDLPFIKNFKPIADENYIVWNRLIGNKFSNTFLKNVKASQIEKKKVNNYIKKLLRWQGKLRFSAKFTGPPRIFFLNSIFSDIKFIDIIRDPRAVVNSLINVKFRINKGLCSPYWIDSLTEKDMKEWKKHKQSAIALAALEWRSVYRQTKKEVDIINPSYLRIRYEDFVISPALALQNIDKFAELDNRHNVTGSAINNIITNYNYKYRDALSQHDVNIINSTCSKEINEMGYRID